MKLLVYTVHFWLKGPRGNITIKMIINTMTQIQDKKQMQHKINQNLKGESKNNRSEMKVEREE